VAKKAPGGGCSWVRKPLDVVEFTLGVCFTAQWLWKAQEGGKDPERASPGKGRLLLWGVSRALMPSHITQPDVCRIDPICWSSKVFQGCKPAQFGISSSGSQEVTNLQSDHLYALEKLPLCIVTLEPGGPIGVSWPVNHHSGQV